MNNINVLSERRHADKGFLPLGTLLLALAFPPTPAVAQDELASAPPTPLFWTAPFIQLGRMASAPLTWDGGDWLLVGALGLDLGILINNDMAVREQWRGGSQFLDQNMPRLGQLGEGYIFGGATALAWGLGATFDNPKLVATSAVALQALAVSGILTVGLKEAIGSVRPSSYENGHRFGDYQRPYGELSFPSGHSNSAFALAEVWGEAYSRLWTYPLAMAIAYSRVYDNQHWPSDVAFGAILGIWTGHMSVEQARERGDPSRLWRFTPLLDKAGAQVSVRF